MALIITCSSCSGWLRLESRFSGGDSLPARQRTFGDGHGLYMIVGCPESICISVPDWLPERISPAFDRLLRYWPGAHPIEWLPGGTPQSGRPSRSHTPNPAPLSLSAFAAGRDHTGAFCHCHELSDLGQPAAAGGSGRAAAGLSRQARCQQSRTSVAVNAPGFLRVRSGPGWVGTLPLRNALRGLR
jgi:hypothetical protein